MYRRKFIAILTALILMIPTATAYAKSWDDKNSDRDFAGAVYTMTNAADNNEVVVFNRDDNGGLTKAGSISTGGAGSGGGLDPLASQGSIVLSRDERWLLAVNAGSNEISVFRVLPHKLVLADKVASGGAFPVSLTIYHNLVYVLNAGASPNITGFFLSHRGQLIPLDDSTRFLGSGGFAQVGFDPEGEMLIVTDKVNNEMLVYAVGRRGLPSLNPVVSPSNGPVPFGFIFDERGHLLVVEAGTNAVSSYDILKDSTLKVISPSVVNGQVAACWIAGNERGYVFTANPGTSSISSYKLKIGKGKLTLLNGTAGKGNTPLDLFIVNGRYLYALDPSSGAIDMFKIERDGSLSNLGTVPGGLSIFAQGIAAR